jgi:predicted phosphodiesterase
MRGCRAGTVQNLVSDVVLLGHTHIQGQRRFGTTTVLNPGSVGLNRDDGSEASYAVLEGGQVILKRVP